VRGVKEEAALVAAVVTGVMGVVVEVVESTKEVVVVKPVVVEGEKE